MEGTSKLFWGFLVAAIAASLSEARCPLVACTRIQYPESCRAPTYMVYDGELCRRCAQCFRSTTPKDERGCPIKPCPRIAIPPGCAARTYYMWNYKMCPDCDVNTCAKNLILKMPN